MPHPPVVTLVQSPACHLCLDAEQALAELAARFPVEVRTVKLDSEEGRALVALHRPPMSPLALVDGVFLSSGRLPRKKLAALLAGRAAAMAAG
ncbi:glutaredoxin [Cellulomonas cellasea]|uniref:glutaredoxin n=1 Tax=Cellulomonas cellasea TaxID=43670 RepID=UPI0025A47444|nr:glutaredoxin [Cellulomonas cellasea]MDM8085323.1 glutaredoxin [Cellulomonas cellasea]